MNPDNARYMLSALIQSLAAVVAIVVTLSLVAIQLSAQSYSSRVIDVYRKTPDIWILISIYTTTIFLGLATIKIIGTNALPTSGLASLEFFIFITYFLGFFAFICLIPYIWNTLALLNPSTVVQLLAKDITEQKLEAVSKRYYGFDENDENDPLLPIIDIIISSIMKYDHTTVRSGANAIVTKANGILNKENEENISHHICEHVERVSMLALKKKEEECCFILLGSLSKIGRNAAENKFKYQTKYAVMALGQIGEKAAENKLEWATGSVVITLNEIGKKAKENEWYDIEKEVNRAIEKIKQKQNKSDSN